jgi:hypothetical protein
VRQPGRRDGSVEAVCGGALARGGLALDCDAVWGPAVKRVAAAVKSTIGKLSQIQIERVARYPDCTTTAPNSTIVATPAIAIAAAPRHSLATSGIWIRVIRPEINRGEIVVICRVERPVRPLRSGSTFGVVHQRLVAARRGHAVPPYACFRRRFLRPRGPAWLPELGRRPSSRFRGRRSSRLDQPRSLASGGEFLLFSRVRASVHLSRGPGSPRLRAPPSSPPLYGPRSAGRRRACRRRGRRRCGGATLRRRGGLRSRA